MTDSNLGAAQLQLNQIAREISLRRLFAERSKAQRLRLKRRAGKIELCLRAETSASHFTAQRKLESAVGECCPFLRSRIGWKIELRRLRLDGQRQRRHKLH